MLVKNGWNPDLAIGMEDTYRTAFCIILGELNGREFDFKKMAWKPPPKS